MIDREIDIQRQGGAMNTFITHPEEGGPYPLRKAFLCVSLQPE